jgi:hypothetical protein
MKTWMMILGVAVLSVAAQCADKATASAMAKGAATLAEQNKTDKAKEMCFKALAFDSDCPEALYELGKIFEKEGNNKTAGDFLHRAAQQMGLEEAANPDFAKKRKDAEARAQRLNPYSAQLTSAFADYSTELNAIVKKVPDTLTLEEACDRVDQLRLKTMVPPEKGPKFERPAPKVPEKPMTERERMIGEMGGFKPKTAPTVVPPDVERTLKDPQKGGWETITGTWKKKGENIYEVTDGKLETKKTNGAVMCIVHKEGTSGKVKIMVRNNEKDEDGYFNSDSSGFGFQTVKDSVKYYTPSSFFSNNRYFVSLDRTEPAPAGPKVQYMVMVDDGKLEYHVNGASKKKTGQVNITKEGTMIVQIEGTAVIEMPRAAGK